jgi:SAM-dependent methyltransferase
MDPIQSDNSARIVGEPSGGDSPYDRIAAIYNRHFGHFAHRVLPALERLLLAGLPQRAEILDVCCGTGQLAAALLDRGFAVTGVDGSAEMLRFARENAPSAQFVQCDVRVMQWTHAFHAAVSTFDSVNHLLSESELRMMLANVHQALLPGGLFVFDLNMEDGFHWRWWGSRRGVESGQEFQIHAVYSPHETLAYNAITFPGTGDRGDAEFRIAERCYSEGEVREALEGAGFATVAVYDGHRDLDLFGEIGRAFFVCRKPGGELSPAASGSWPSLRAVATFPGRYRTGAMCVRDGIWPSEGVQRELGPGSRRLQAVEEVLCRLPPEPYERLRQQSGSFQWFIPSHLVLGQVHPFPASREAPARGELSGYHSRVVYLSPQLEQHSWDLAVTVVAHELAHVILDHELWGVDAETYDRQEAAVRRALQAWRFNVEMERADQQLREIVFKEVPVNERG